MRTRLRRRDTQLTLRSKRRANASSAKPWSSCSVRSSQPCSNALSVASVCRSCRKISASGSGISHTTAATVSRLQPTEAADAFVAVHHHVRRARRHDHDRHLLAGLRQRRQQPPLARRLPHPQPLVPHIELMKFQLHGLSSMAPTLAPRRSRLARGPGEVGREVQRGQSLDRSTGLARLTGEVGPFPLSNQ